MGRRGPRHVASVKPVINFLMKGLIWGVIGLSLIGWARPSGAAALAMSAIWLAVLAALAWITSRDERVSLTGMILAWAVMAAGFCAIAYAVAAIDGVPPT